MKNPTTFVDIEASLVSRLTKAWTAQVKSASSRMAEALVRGETDEAVATLEAMDYAVFRGAEGQVRYLSKTALVFGASNARDGVEEVSFVKEKTEGIPLEEATTQFEALLIEGGATIRREVRSALEKMARIVSNRRSAGVQKAEVPLDEAGGVDLFGPDIVLEGVTEAELIALYGEALEVIMAETGKGVFEIVASLHSSRLSAYGFLLEAELLGYTMYRVNEVLDGRTCQVCRFMDGRTFEVSTAFSKLDNLLRVTDSSALKMLSPWPSNTKAGLAELEDLTMQEMAARGFDTPPYHPRCRGLLDRL